jgi:hypothetical protein
MSRSGKANHARMAPVTPWTQTAPERRDIGRAGPIPVGMVSLKSCTEVGVTQQLHIWTGLRMASQPAGAVARIRNAIATAIVALRCALGRGMLRT